jgi:hypothetical protein
VFSFRPAIGRWSIACGGCLKYLPDFDGTREELVAYLRDVVFWEVQSEGDMCRCTACSREAREVKLFDRR